MKLITLFTSRNNKFTQKALTLHESTFKTKAMLPWILLEIVFTSAGYLQTKIFAWKRDCVISSKLLIPRR